MFATKSRLRFATLGLALMFIGTQLQAPVYAFTQGADMVGSVVPQGHEWITRQAAIELLGGERALQPDVADPRRTWPRTAKAQNLTLNGEAQKVVARIKQLALPPESGRNYDLPYAASYRPILDAIMGVRWVDIGGFNFIEAKILDTKNCLDLVTQEAPDLQYDHFMRKPSDQNAQGGIASAKESTQRFIEYFVAAAMAENIPMKVWNGGGSAGEVTVDRQFFLFGRALHLFEDSFSPDHTVRTADDYFRQVRQVKSYLCASGSEQHAHLSPPGSAFYETGDVIWKSTLLKPNDNNWWGGYQPSNIRPYALAAIEGTKDVWAAFIRSTAKPVKERKAYAEKEARTVANYWLKIDEQQMRQWYSKPEHRGSTYVKASLEATHEDGGKGASQNECMAHDWKGQSQATKLAEFDEGRRLCLYNMLPDIANTHFDSQLHTPFFWRWRNIARLEVPPKDWKFQNPQKKITAIITIANRVDQVKLRHEGDYVYNDYKANDEKNSLQFEVELTPGLPLEQNNIVFKVVGMENRVLGRFNSGGLIQLFPPDDTSRFALERRKDGYYNIRNTKDNQYVYMDANRKSYIYNGRSPEEKDAQWIIDGLPESYLVDGTYWINHVISVNPLKTIALNFGKTTGTYRLSKSPPDFLRNDHVGFVKQPDGAYKMLYIDLNKYLATSTTDDNLHNSDENGASKFYLEPQQQNNFYLIRTEDKRYWTADVSKDEPFVSLAKPCYKKELPGYCEEIIRGPGIFEDPECKAIKEAIKADEGKNGACSAPLEFKLRLVLP